VDLRNEKINYKIREHSLAKVPVIAVVGRKEAETGQLALRRLGGEGQNILALEEALRVLKIDATPPDIARAQGLVPAAAKDVPEAAIV
jgi:threonyl-tRNA synthetase